MTPVASSIHTLNAVTATTTGAPIDIRTATKVTIFYQRSAHTSGSTAFSVEVSPNYVTKPTETALWVAYNKLITNVTNTNAQFPTRVASISLAANGSGFLTMDLLGGDTFEAIRVTATETTDGTHDAWVLTETNG